MVTVVAGINHSGPIWATVRHHRTPKRPLFMHDLASSATGPMVAIVVARRFDSPRANHSESPCGDCPQGDGHSRKEVKS